MISREVVLNILENKDPFSSISVKRAVEGLKVPYSPRLTWYQKACLIHRIHEYKCEVRAYWKVEHTAELIDMTPGHVYMMLRLFRACGEIPGLHKIKNIREAQKIVKAKGIKARKKVHDKVDYVEV